MINAQHLKIITRKYLLYNFKNYITFSHCFSNIIQQIKFYIKYTKSCLCTLFHLVVTNDDVGCRMTCWQSWLDRSGSDSFVSTRGVNRPGTLGTPYQPLTPPTQGKINMYFYFFQMRAQNIMRIYEYNVYVYTEIHT